MFDKKLTSLNLLTPMLLGYVQTRFSSGNKLSSRDESKNKNKICTTVYQELMINEESSNSPP